MVSLDVRAQISETICRIFLIFGMMKNLYLGQVYVFSEFWKNPRWPTYATFSVKLVRFLDVQGRISETICRIFLIFAMRVDLYLGQVHVFSKFWKNPKWPTYGTFSVKIVQFLDVQGQISGTIHRIFLIFGMIIDLYQGQVHVFSEFKKNPRWPT